MQEFAFDKAIVIRKTLTLKALRVMKITAVLLTAFCLHAGASGHAQTTITISAKNSPLEKVFAEIEKQTEYKFVYRWELLQKTKPVDLQVKQASLKEVLDLCLRDQSLSYQVIDYTIIITKKETEKDNPALDLVDVKGKVINEKGEPISGATVAVKGVKKLTKTNENGEFFLVTVDDNATLVVSHISFETSEINLGGRKDLTIQLKFNVSEMNAVLINTGIQVVKPNEIAGSVEHINNELVNRKVSTDILSRLKGVSSVLFDKTADNNLDISIRGRSTIYANTQPLIVVDNFPYSGNINDINPNDIESISILKDAAAASIWGAFSGNGVIVITTKKGKYKQSATLEINSSISIANKPDLYYDRQFLNASDFIDLEIFLFGKGFYDVDINNTTSMPPLSPVVEILHRRKIDMINPTDSAAQIDALRQLDIRDDYSKYFYRRAIEQQYAVNLKGGSEKTSYYLSAGYNKNLSAIVGDENQRISVNLLSTYRPVEKLELTTQVVFTQSNSENNGMSNISAAGKYSTIYPYAQLADEKGNPLSVIKDYRSSFAQSPPVPGLLDWQYFPLRELQLSNNVSRNMSNRIASGIKYTVIKGLTAEIKYQYLKGVNEGQSAYNPETYSNRNRVNRFTTIINNTIIRRNIPLGTILTITNSTLTGHSGRGQLSYSGRWDRHAISTIAGIDIQSTKTEGHSGTSYGYDPAVGTTIAVNYDSLYTTYPSNSRTKIGGAPAITPYTLNNFLSYFANVSYTYKSRYIFSASIRSDQSNLFGVKTNQKKVPLWSTGAKWDLSKENFYNIGWLPSLQFRTTYGYNGNLTKSITAMTTATFFPNSINSLPYANIATPGNPELRWEKVGIVNIGFDFETPKETITGSIEYWHKTGIDMIGDATIPSSTGFTTARGNFSNMVGNGIEIGLNTINARQKIRWETNLLFNYATDKVTKNRGRTLQIPGRPVNWVHSYRWGGLDANGDPVGYLGDTLSKAYGTITGRASANPYLYLYNGPGNPQFYGSLNNTLSWKGFTLSVVVLYKLGYYFKRNSILYGALFNGSRGHIDFERRWQQRGDETLTDVPSLVYPLPSARDAFYSGSEVLVEKGDHIRLQDISLRYDISKKRWSKLPFDHCQFYFYANNIGIIWRTNNKGIDPDAQSGYPEPFTMAFGIRAGL